MIRYITQVIENHICTGCGTCVGICSAGACEMAETAGGQLLPRINTERCTDCGLCHKVCPAISVSVQMSKYIGNPFVGPIQSAYLGKATDPMIAAVGQTGGLGRILLASSLELGLIDMAVCVVDNPQRPLRPMTALVRTPQEALAVSRSKYCPVPVNELIGTIRNTQGRIAFVGLGCHMQGLQLALENQKQLQDKIVLKIGLFCDRVLTYAAADYLVRCARAKSQDVVAFDYRHKAWRGWPGDTRVVMGNGRVSNVPRYRRTDAGEVFTPIHCRLCIDKLNILSDISLGDPHGLAKGKQVPTATLVRTAAGQNVLRATQEAGKIILTPIGPEMIIELQNAAKGVDKSIAFGREMLYRGYELPCFLQTGPLRVTEGQASSVGVKWAIGLSLFLSTARGARLIRRFPSWTSLLWGTPRRYYKRWRGRLRRVFKRVMNLSRCGRVAD